MSQYHTPVLAKEVLQFLSVTKNGRYIDATVGGGGHTSTILAAGGRVLGIDADEEAIEEVRRARRGFQSADSKYKIGEDLTLVKGNFRDIDKIAQKSGFDEANGVLFDLGVSSYQLDTPGRGFSFQHDVALDMRMDKELVVSAKDLINGLTKKELYELFTRIGEEPNAHAIVNTIIRARGIKPIETTGQLADLVAQAYRGKQGKIHPATKVFLALRVAVNDELGTLRVALPKALSITKKGGRIVVISFHSLEDRIVKQTFGQFLEQGKGRIVTDKPIMASVLESDTNRRARSAKLRAFEKI